MTMQINHLEKVVLTQFLRQYDREINKRWIDFDAVFVTERAFTGVGFLTDFRRSNDLKLCNDGYSDRWGKTGARLNESHTESGYLIYIDDGYLTTLEGYTYGEDWPEEINAIEVYQID